MLARVLFTAFLFGTSALAQTADELVAKNIQARGGLEKIKAVNTVRMRGKLLTGGFEAAVEQDNKRPNLVRQEFSLQGMTAVQAYDGTTGWQIQPFSGRRDPEIMGQEDMKDILEAADFEGPLVDAAQKGNKIEYLGTEDVDGGDAYKLKVTEKSGDIRYCYLDPDSYMEIKEEIHQLIRGAMRESEVEYGSYKQVAGVFYPFSLVRGSKGSTERDKISISEIEVNVPIDNSRFSMPASKNVYKQPPKQPPQKP